MANRSEKNQCVMWNHSLKWQHSGAVFIVVQITCDNQFFLRSNFIIRSISSVVEEQTAVASFSNWLLSCLVTVISKRSSVIDPPKNWNNQLLSQDFHVEQFSKLLYSISNGAVSWCLFALGKGFKKKAVGNYCFSLATDQSSLPLLFCLLKLYSWEDIGGNSPVKGTGMNGSVI